MINEFLTIRGDLDVLLRDASTGEVKLKKTFPNLVVTTGKELLASRLASATNNVVGYMAVGSGNTAPAVTDTTLVAEISRVATSVAGGTPTGNTVLYTATFPAGVGTGSLQEAGLFNAVSGGSMLSRTTYAVINKGASDELIINWTITIG